MDRGDVEAVLKLADEVEQMAPMSAEWFRAIAAAKSERWSDCIGHCHRIIESDPAVLNTRRLLCTAQRALADFASAAAVCGEILDIADEPEPSDLWASMTVGTLAQDWDLVRRAGVALGMEFSTSEGPIEEEWSPCLITFVDPGEGESTWMAARTGPATARIVSIGDPHKHQRYGDQIVFEPVPLDPMDPDSDAMPRYEHLLTIVEGGYRAFAVEGLAPHEHEWVELREAAVDAGFPVWRYPTDPVMVEGEERETLLCTFAVADGDPVGALVELINDLSASWSDAPSFEMLAEQAGLDPEPHRRILDQIYRISD